MFIKRNLWLVMVALVAVALIAGCSAAMKESGGDQTGDGDLSTVASAVGINACYNCHSNTAVDGELIFDQWAMSRHGNTNESPSVRGSCNPCHNPVGDDQNLAKYVGPGSLPDLRGVISCEGCHGGGSLHFGIGPLGNENPGTAQVCANCHGFNPDEVYGAHHYLDSDRYWENVGGDSAHDAHDAIDEDSDHVPVAIADTTVASVAFSVFSLPASADSSWLGNYQGPYFFNPDRTIRDTHFNELWLLNEPDKVTIWKAPTARFGYVNTANNSPNSGMVNFDDPNSCLGSCHDPHEFDLTIQREWASGAHHPVPIGPIVEVDGEPFPSGPASFGAVDHGGFSASCVRCHTSMGFAEVAPGFGYGSATLTPPNSDGYITCNACHDGQGYPTSSDSRLRLDGDAVLFDNDAGDGTPRLVITDVGPSATCMYCHQGRESGLSVENEIAAGDTHTFINRHYLAAAAILYGSEAKASYQYSGQTYAGANTFSGHGSALSLCVDCHLRGIDDHTFKPQLSDCTVCHGALADFDELAEPGGPGNDYDGDTVAESFHDEIEGLQVQLLDEIYAYADSVLGLPIVYSPDGYPYFFNDTDADGIADESEVSFGNRYATFDDRLLAAAFNYHSGLDPCGPIHNHRYVIQTLYDSADDLDDGLFNGSVQGNRP